MDISEAKSGDRAARLAFVARTLKSSGEVAAAQALALALKEIPAVAAEEFEVVANVAETVAELGKDEVARSRLGADPSLIPAITLLLARRDLPAQARLQILRAIGNLCFDSPENRTRLLQAGAVRHLAETLRGLVSEEEGKGEDAVVRGEIVQRSRMVSSAAVLNLATDDEEVQKALVEAGVVDSLVWLLRNASSPEERDFAMKALTCFTDNEKALGDLSKRDAVSQIVRSLEEAETDEDAEETIAVLRALRNSDGALPAFASSSLLTTLQRISRTAASDRRAIASSAATTLSVALAEDACLQLVFSGADESKELLNTFVAWMTPGRDPRLRVAGAIAVGNICRSDANAEVLGSHAGVLQGLISMMAPESMPSVLHAALSSTKNLVKLSANRTRVLELGILPSVIAAANDPQAPIQLHACGILRSLCNSPSNSTSLIADLVRTDGLLDRIMHLSKSEEFGVATEATRLLATFVKLGKSSEITARVVEAGGVASFMRLYAQDKHAILQVESVLALVLVAVASPDGKRAVLDAGAVVSANEVLTKSQRSEVLCNTLTLLSQLFKDDAVSDPELSAKTLQAAESLAAQHPMEAVRRHASNILADLKGIHPPSR